MTEKHHEVPELVLGFDTETTGLATSSERAISYGFALYRNMELVWSDHYYVVPDVEISPGAERVHGISRAMLEAKAARGEAHTVEQGLITTLAILRQHHAAGAWICGANVSHFDIDMFQRSYGSVMNKTVADDGLQLDELRIIDVISHDIAMESRAENPRRRNLTALSMHYGVRVGGHDALNDAKAACEVFFAQVAQNTNDWTGLRPPVSSMDPAEIEHYRETTADF